jgi:hypothetical protein
MKLILLLLLGGPCSGQMILRNTSLTVPDSPIMYRGVPNYFIVDNIKTLTGYTINTMGKCEVSLNSENGFSLICADTGVCRLRIQKKGQTLFSAVYQVYNITEFAARLGYYTDTVKSIVQVIAAGGLSVYIPGTIYYVPARVVSYSLRIRSPQNSQLYAAVAEGGLLTEQMKTEIRKLAPGSRLYFENIIVVTANSKPRRIKDLIIFISR